MDGLIATLIIFLLLYQEHHKRPFNQPLMVSQIVEDLEVTNQNETVMVPDHNLLVFRAKNLGGCSWTNMDERFHKEFLELGYR